MPQKLTLISVGKLKNTPLSTASLPLLKNLKRYTQFNLIETKDVRRSRHKTNAVSDEAKLIVSAIPKSSYRVALDETGTLRDTKALVKWMTDLERKSVGHLCFIIGGPDGLDPSILDDVDESMALSPMTFTHEMARFILIEQLYRVLSFRAGHPYHRA